MPCCHRKRIGLGVIYWTVGPFVKGLLSSGMNHGAALGFWVAGLVTAIPACNDQWRLIHGTQ